MTGGYSISGLAKELNLREHDVYRLVGPLGLPQQLAVGRQTVLVEDCQVAALEAVRRVMETMDRTSNSQAASAFGILVDKLRILSGSPDQRVEVTHFNGTEVERRDQMNRRVADADRLIDRISQPHPRVRQNHYESTKRHARGETR